MIVEQVVEIVGDAAGQLADGFHLLRHGELLARLDQFFLSVAPFRSVAKDIGKADQRTVLVANGCDRTGDEYQRAALLDAPALDFVFPFLGSDCQRAVRLAGAAFIRPVEDAKMLAENFIGGVTGDLLGCGVPACDMSRRYR